MNIQRDYVYAQNVRTHTLELQHNGGRRISLSLWRHYSTKMTSKGSLLGL